MIVSSQVDKYTNHAIDQVKAAQWFQNIIMHRGSHQLMDGAIKHLKHCPVTRGDILTAEDIFGPNLGSLKRKTVTHPSPHIRARVDPVPPDILHVHQSIVLAVDIMFINKIPSLMMTSHNLHFGTIEALPNCQV